MIFLKPELEPHILQRLKERSAEIAGLPWLYSLLKIINDYIPDDWRLGLRSDEFIIRTFGDKSITMVGKTKRSNANSKNCIHIVSTIIPKGGFPIGERFVNDKDLGKDTAGRPNLYVLEIPEDKNIQRLINKNWFYHISPLAARQYEKKNPHQKPNNSYEYHRIHPLKKNGLQLDIFGWIKWYEKSGKAIWGTDIYPKSDWHGENYWRVKGVVTEEYEKQLNLHFLNRINGNFK